MLNNKAIYKSLSKKRPPVEVEKWSLIAKMAIKDGVKKRVDGILKSHFTQACSST